MSEERKPGRKGRAYRFKIDAWTPTTIPMLRLAEYMRELAQILGETSQVHFHGLTAGSTVVNYDVEKEALPKVRNRIVQVRQGDAPTEALRAFQTANKMLRDDNATGSLKIGATILQFPGRKQIQEQFTSVRQQGFFDGIVIGVRGRDETRHITMHVEDKQISGFVANRTIAKQLAAKYDEAVRLFGKGKWQRDQEGNWTLLEFKIEMFEALNDAPLSSVLADLRAVPVEWGDDAYEELDVIRHGPMNKPNGHH